ncbi:MAG TPA: sulfite exporter TauE/SafE family protein [Ktedonobacteraceae bacterium]|nr:sulfite exporter TauE/SafE family protein [Ktedonobacteraceae bacterium]
MTIPFAILLFIAAILGGTLNAVAGGGTFITLPSLIFTGVLPINANATSTVALWPGTVASISAYRKELVKQDRLVLLVLGVTSLIGGVLGAELLIGTSQSTFVILLPYLLLLATVLFAVSTPITTWMRERRTAQRAQQESQESAVAVPGKVTWLRLVVIACFQLIIAVYGGYFGGGIGILMLATLGLMGMENIHEMNSVKTLLTALINGVALVIFIIRGIVEWPQALVMIAGAIIGGYGAAYFARKIDQRFVRVFVILVGLSMTVYFFVHPG